jgi:hypothetical protein
MLHAEREGDTQTSRGFGRELGRTEREDYTIEPSDE